MSIPKSHKSASKLKTLFISLILLSLFFIFSNASAQSLNLSIVTGAVCAISNWASTQLAFIIGLAGMIIIGIGVMANAGRVIGVVGGVFVAVAILAGGPALLAGLMPGVTNPCA